MTNSPNSEHRSPTKVTKNRLWLLILCRVGVGFAGLLLVGLGWGVWRLNRFIHEDLAPLAAEGLTNSLNRPVELGRVKGFSLQGVEFDTSQIPATATDPDFAQVESVEVGFDLWSLLWNRRLLLDVTLVNPSLYLQQDTNGRWLTTKISPPGKGTALRTDLHRLWFRNGKLTLLPSPQGNQAILKNQSPIKSAATGQSLSFVDVNGHVRLFDDNQRLQLDVTAKPVNGERLTVQGEIVPRNLASQLQIQGENISAQDVSNLIPLPFKLPQGRAWGNLRVEYEPGAAPLLFGNVRVKDLQVDIPRVPLPFTQGQGNIKFDQTAVILENARSVYGQTGFTASGVIDRETGFRLRGRTDVVSAANVQKTLDLQLPVPVVGNLQANLQLDGAIDNPVLQGNVKTVKVALVDRLKVKTAQTDFNFSPATGLVKFNQIQATPMVGGKITGSGEIQLVNNPQIGFNLVASNIPGDAIARLYDVPPGLRIGTVQGTIGITGKPNLVTTRVNWEAPSATYPVRGETIINPNRHIDLRNIVASVAGGQVRVNGSWQNDRWQLVANTSRVGILPFLNPENLENININHLRQSSLNGQFTVTGTSTPFQIAQITGQGGGINLGGGTIQIPAILFTPSGMVARLNIQGVRLGSVLQESQQVLANPLSGELSVAVPRDNGRLQTIVARGNLDLPVGGGSIQVNDLLVQDGRYQATVNFQNNSLPALAPLPQQFRGRLTGAVRVVGVVDSLQIANIQAKGQARISLGGGTITANNFVLDNGRYSLDGTVKNLPLQQFIPLTPTITTIKGGLDGEFRVAGDATNLDLAKTLVVGEGRLNVAGGRVSATNFRLANGAYQAALNARNVQLNQLNSQLTGQMAANLQVVGNVDQLNLGNIRAVGQVDLSQGLAGLNRPIQANVGWNGEKLIVERAVGRDFAAQGYIFANAKGAGIPEITQINLDVDVRNYPLQNLPVQLPVPMALGGVADFRGQVSGKLPVPNLIGNVTTRNFKVGELAFEPLLTGNFRSTAGQGLQLDIGGKQDRIALNLDGNNNPQSFAIRFQEAAAVGRMQGGVLQTQVENFPLGALNLTIPGNPWIGNGLIAGNFSGELQTVPQTLATQGNIAINQPQVGRIQGDRVTANFSYAQGKLSLGDSSFQRGASTYGFVGTMEPTNGIPRIQGKITAKNGDIQDILTTLQIFHLNDLSRGFNPPTYGSAADLDVMPQKVANRPLLQQLQRYSEILALLEQQQQARLAASPIPDLADLKGRFNSEITLDTTNPQAPNVQFEFLGNNFTWGRTDEPNRYFQAEKVVVAGRFADNLLTLRPLRIESDERVIAFSGTLGTSEQIGRLQIDNFPLQILNNLVRLPVGLTGNLNGSAAISGNIFNPQATGEISVSEGTLNQKGINAASAGFNYANGLLSFGSQIDVANTTPVTIEGSIPYRLPFALVGPVRENIDLKIQVENEGLAVINLLSNQVAYNSGTGRIDVQVGGTLGQPTVEGVASLTKANFSAQALPGEITDVTGGVKFDFDRIIVDNLSGNFNQGRIVANGEIPIITGEDGQQLQNPLLVNLERVLLNLKGLYLGGVSGNLMITGSALDPILGGDIQLSNGQVLLPEPNSNDTPSLAKNLQTLGEETDSFPPQENPTRFRNLFITLGNNLRVTRPPILNFTATGTLKLNGSFLDPIPEGEIRLRGGGVNLFTTQFNLARGYRHTATFRPSQPRDPELDIRLFAKVFDIRPSSDINRLGNGGISRLESVRVEANITGLASQLNENLELRSTPSRTENEIIALLGGGFVDSQGRADSTLGLINIAGSAVFNNFQTAFSQIGTAFGLSELRIFPTLLSQDPEAGRNASSLELAAEAGVDISPRFSVSALKILTASDPLQLGINYRINQEFRLRGATNFFDDNRAVLEFERRF